MADLFIKQARVYASARPTYPQELFDFIFSKTPCHNLAWDVGTGSGQAIPPLAKVFKNVVGTDTSHTQLEHAPKLPNVKYRHHTSPTMSLQELEQNVASESTLDLVTVAQALHWFDLPKFYDQVKWALKKPNGVFAAWCYTTPEVNDKVDSVFGPYFKESGPYWDKARKLVNDKYMDIDFPFEPVDGLEDTGPIKFKSEMTRTFDEFMTYLRSWSAYVTAKEKGVELLTDEMVEKFKNAWNDGSGEDKKVVTYPIYLRIGKVGNLTEG